jgi:cytoskeletal protein RodZ
MFEQSTTVGRYLQRQRETKQISLDTVSKSTRIKPTFLQALEQDDFELLPAETYVRGFLCNYAKFIQADPAEVLDLYRKQVEPTKDQTLEKRAKTSPVKYVKNHLFDFLATIVGAAPTYSVSKSILPPKD